MKILSKKDMNLNLTQEMASSLLQPLLISSTVESRGVPFQNAGLAGLAVATANTATSTNTLYTILSDCQTECDNKMIVRWVFIHRSVGSLCYLNAFLSLIWDAKGS